MNEGNENLLYTLEREVERATQELQAAEAQADKDRKILDNLVGGQKSAGINQSIKTYRETVNLKESVVRTKREYLSQAIKQLNDFLLTPYGVQLTDLKRAQASGAASSNSNITDADTNYAKGKAAFLQKNKSDALTFFKLAKDNYKAAKKDMTLNASDVDRAEKRLSKLTDGEGENEGKYSNAKILAL